MADTSTSNAFDMNAIIDIQKQYAKDLLEISENGNVVNPSKLNDELDELEGAFDDSNKTSHDLILKQNDINSLLTNENARLERESGAVEQAKHVQNRLINLNTSYGKRFNAFNKVFYAVILSCFMILVFIYQKKWFDVIPDSINTILYVLILSVALIYIMFVIADIASRDKMNFNKIYVPAPEELSEADREKMKKDGKLLGLDSTCVGANCCSADNNTVWDPELGYCKYDTDDTSGSTDDSSGDTSAFTLLSQVKDEELKESAAAKYYSPSEFSGYAKI